MENQNEKNNMTQKNDAEKKVSTFSPPKKPSGFVSAPPRMQSSSKASPKAPQRPTTNNTNSTNANTTNISSAKIQISLNENSENENNNTEEKEKKDKKKYLIPLFSIVLVLGIGIFIYFIVSGSIFNFSSAVNVNSVVVSEFGETKVFRNLDSLDITINSIQMETSDEVEYLFNIKNNSTDEYVYRFKFNPIGNNQYDPSYMTMTSNLSNYILGDDGYYYSRSTIIHDETVSFSGTLKLTAQKDILKRKDLVAQFVVQKMEKTAFITAVLSNDLNNNFGSAPLDWKNLIVGD